MFVCDLWFCNGATNELIRVAVFHVFPCVSVPLCLIVCLFLCVSVLLCLIVCVFPCVGVSLCLIVSLFLCSVGFLVFLFLRPSLCLCSFVFK